MCLLLTDVFEVKSLLGIPLSNNCDDKLLGFLIEMASNWIQEWLGRDMEYKQRTEYYNGTNTIKLILRSRPVFTTGLEVKVDDRGFFGTPTDSFSDDALVYGTNYALNIDQDDGTSRSGILIRIDRLWYKSYYAGRGLLSPWMGPSPGSIKVTYNAGFTVDTIPAAVRLAATTLVANIKYMLPLGLDLNSDQYGQKSIGINNDMKNSLLRQVTKAMLLPFKNWFFG